MKVFQNLLIVGGVVLAVTALTVTVALGGHGGGHHPEPGHGSGGNHHLGNNFHHYNHQDHYGNGKNVWCDGLNPQLNRHHHGNSVRADLDGKYFFSGGFCIKSGLQQGHSTLEINHRNIPHDKVWLRNRITGNYYPVATTGNTIAVEDGGWADQDGLTNGAVEAEVLFSSRTPDGGTSPGNGGSGGGGCRVAGLPFGILALCVLWLLHNKAAG
ncbi:MAG: hypothetical protein FWG71_02775 [Synergistaceae bacterium]|nr:hypothetical protein [Synergistaceae bacterium]